MSDKGFNYAGKHNKSKFGNNCLPWMKVQQNYSLIDLKLMTKLDNYCRNPDKSNSPWCFVRFNKREECSIRSCEIHPSSFQCIIMLTNESCPIWMSKPIKINNKIDWPISNQSQLCCMKPNQFQTKQPVTSINLLPIPKNGCFIQLQPTNNSNSYSICPIGFKIHQLIKFQQLILNYQPYLCCQIDINKNQFSPAITNVTEQIYYLYGYFSYQCLENNTDMFQFKSATFDNGIFKQKLCLKKKNKSLDKWNTNAPLIFFSTSQCPNGSITENRSHLNLSLNSCKIMPFSYDKKHHISTGGLCLYSPTKMCPTNYSKYSLTTNYQQITNVFCCLSQQEVPFIWTYPLKVDSTLLFIKYPNNQCPSLLVDRNKHYGAYVELTYKNVDMELVEFCQVFIESRPRIPRLYLSKSLKCDNQYTNFETLQLTNQYLTRIRRKIIGLISTNQIISICIKNYDISEMLNYNWSNINNQLKRKELNRPFLCYYSLSSSCLLTNLASSFEIAEASKCCFSINSLFLTLEMTLPASFSIKPCELYNQSSYQCVTLEVTKESNVTYKGFLLLLFLIISVLFILISSILIGYIIMSKRHHKIRHHILEEQPISTQTNMSMSTLYYRIESPGANTIGVDNIPSIHNQTTQCYLPPIIADETYEQVNGDIYDSPIQTVHYDVVS